jgi:hypothetical protein
MPDGSSGLALVLQIDDGKTRSLFNWPFPASLGLGGSDFGDPLSCSLGLVLRSLDPF